jgi:hypothetical protein
VTAIFVEQALLPDGWHDNTRIVISDLHLGAADRFDIFDGHGKTDSFIAFLEVCAARLEPVELVLNGDFVDFLQLTPWDTDPSRSAALIKARTIATANGRLLAALGTFLGAPKNSLRVLLGNHDIELAFDDVWAQIEKPIRSVAPAARLIRHNERVSYNPTINGVHIAIEHGNKRDYWNQIHYPELFQDAEKGTALYRHPPGTRLVYNLMNGFKNHFLFVDLLKPEIPTVPLLLFRLRPLKASASVPSATWNLLKAFAYGLAGAVRRRIAGPQLAPPGSAPARRCCSRSSSISGSPSGRRASRCSTRTRRRRFSRGRHGKTFPPNTPASTIN